MELLVNIHGLDRKDRMNSGSKLWTEVDTRHRYRNTMDFIFGLVKVAILPENNNERCVLYKCNFANATLLMQLCLCNFANATLLMALYQYNFANANLLMQLC